LKRRVQAQETCWSDHENPEIDLVISENERFAAVEKLMGMPARIARAANPRR
jgi:hypothetical protein